MNCSVLHGHDVTILIQHQAFLCATESCWKNHMKTFPTTQCHRRSLYLACFLHAVSVHKNSVTKIDWKKLRIVCLTFRLRGIVSFGMRKIAQANRVEPMDTKFSTLTFSDASKMFVCKGDSSFGNHDFQVPFLKFRSYNSNFKGPQSRWLCKLGIGACVT